MNVAGLTEKELAERCQPWAVKFIRKHGREPDGIDSLAHRGNYMLSKGNEANMGDLSALSRLFNLAVDELLPDTPADIPIGNCSLLIANMLASLRLIEQRRQRRREGIDLRKRGPSA